jgi:hypothetical protein
MTALHPLPVIDATDDVLAQFETDVSALANPSDAAVLRTVETVVLALNALNEEHGFPIETGEREELCQFMDDLLTEAGIDAAALMDRQGRQRAELTDEWRDW